MLQTVKLTAPAHWASYLINNDASGLEPRDTADADAWLRAEELGWPVDVGDTFFAWRHDAPHFAPGATCAEYTFLIGG